MASTSTFSTSAEEAIAQTINLQPEDTPAPYTPAFEEYYEIAETAKQIEEWGSHRIALQFPDELLHDSVPIYRLLKARLSAGRDLYLLADTSYGSCCVDEVAASHVDADASVHYGHACMSQTSRLPVIYIFGKKELDINQCVRSLADYFQSTLSASPHPQAARTVVLRHHVSYSHVIATVADRLRVELNDSHFRIVHEPLPTRTRPRAASKSSGSVSGSPLVSKDEDLTTSTSVEGELERLDISEPEPGIQQDSDAAESTPTFVWIGDESPTLTKLLMTSGGIDVVSYSPTSGTVQAESHLTNKLLMRRYALLQKARDADVFGILVGTLGVASYLPLLNYLRLRLKRAHKKSYTVSVGKINPSKLANFMEIECWIWVACGEGMVDSKEFLKPIITPYELEFALQPEPSWSGKYVFDFDEILAQAAQSDSTRHGEDEEKPIFSLVTGKYRHAKRYGANAESDPSTTDPTSQALTERNQANALAKLGNNAAAQFLQSRSYQGLEQRLGMDEPSVLEQGRSGVASGYVDVDHRE